MKKRGRMGGGGRKSSLSFFVLFCFSSLCLSRFFFSRSLSASLFFCCCLFVRFSGCLSIIPLSFLLGHRQAAAERLALQLLLRDLLLGRRLRSSVGGRGLVGEVPEGDVSDHEHADEAEADGDDGAGGGVGLGVRGGLVGFLFYLWRGRRRRREEEVERAKFEKKRHRFLIDRFLLVTIVFGRVISTESPFAPFRERDVESRSRAKQRYQKQGK